MLFAVLNGNREDMEDAEQEILLALSIHLNNFAFRSAFSTWLYRFCRNRAIDFLRKKRSETRKSEKVQKDLSFDMDIELNPENVVLNIDKKKQIQALLAAMNERDRTILILKDIEGMSVDEIARSTGLAKGTVKSRLFRSRKKAMLLWSKSYES